MDDKLRALIILCEEEHSVLFQLIANYIEEEEYELAHFHQKALYQLNRKLQVLRTIEDEYYDRKKSYQNTIKYLESELDSGISGDMKEYLQARLMDAKEALDRLNQIPKKEKTSENDNILFKTLSSLLNKKIKSFKLILSKKEQLLIEFTYSSKLLKFTLPNIKFLLKGQTLYDFQIDRLIMQGFRLSENENKLVLSLAKKEEVLEKAMTILAKIVFDIFSFGEFKNESCIEIKERSNR